MQRSYTAMPVVRIENYLLFPGGKTRRISRASQLLYWARIWRNARV